MLFNWNVLAYYLTFHSNVTVSNVNYQTIFYSLFIILMTIENPYIFFVI